MANIVPALTWLENERVWVWVWQAHSACKRAKMKGGRERQTGKKKKKLPGRQKLPSCRPALCTWTQAAQPRRVIQKGASSPVSQGFSQKLPAPCPPESPRPLASWGLPPVCTEA